MPRISVRRPAALAALLVIVTSAGTPAQDREELPKTPGFVLKALQLIRDWKDPREPVRIAGPLYFVGTKGLGVYLITTSQGHILVNTGMPGSGPMIEASIRTLGLKPEDIKLLLTGHAHIDHAGGHAFIKKRSGAQIVAMTEEVALLESGGRTDFHYGTSPDFFFDKVTVDRVIHDGDTIVLGEVAVTARLTPGHTKGSATYIVNIADAGRTYSVVFPNGMGVNPGYRLARNAQYPGIADDYRRTFHVLETLQPDIWLDPHTEQFAFDKKLKRAARNGVAAWVDPEGYREYVADRRKTFERELKRDLRD